MKTKMVLLFVLSLLLFAACASNKEKVAQNPNDPYAKKCVQVKSESGDDLHDAIATYLTGRGAMVIDGRFAKGDICPDGVVMLASVDFAPYSSLIVNGGRNVEIKGFQNLVTIKTLSGGKEVRMANATYASKFSRTADIDQITQEEALEQAAALAIQKL